MSTLPLMYFAIGFAAAAAAKSMTSILGSLARAWQRQTERMQFNELDDHALRDLGVDRSEFQSYCAESELLATPTRIRTGLVPHATMPWDLAQATQVRCQHCARVLGSHRQLFAGASVAARP